MQLDINQSFAPQISPLTGKNFENIVASCYFYLGYFVKRNLTVKISNQTAAEIDVLASLITPLNEIRVAIECKGQTPSFNDLRKFSTVKTIIASSNIELSLVAYGANDIRNEHLMMSKVLGIQLLKKDDLSKIVLPILWGSNELVRDRMRWLNRYLTIFKIQDYYLCNVYGRLTDPVLCRRFGDYIRFLYSDLWSIKDPIEQIEVAFDNAQNRFNGFTSTVARAMGTTERSQLINPTVPEVQLAMLLELEHRIFNIVGIARCSILARSQNGRDIITQRSPIIRGALNDLCDYNMSITKFSTFVFRWIYLWGGFIIRKSSLEEGEYDNLAKESGLSIENVKLFIKIIRDIYSSGNSLFYQDNDKEFFKYIPASFRALGLMHRRVAYDPVYTSVDVFSEDRRNSIILEESVADIGGIPALQF